VKKQANAQPSGRGTTEVDQERGGCVIDGLLMTSDKFLGAVETTLLCLGLMFMVVIVFGQGVLSKPLHFDWPWAEQLAMNLMVLVMGVGASVAVRERRHVVMDDLVRLLPLRGRAFTAALTAALCVAVCIAAFHPAMNNVRLFRTEFSHMAVEIPWIARRGAVGLRATHLAIPLWYMRAFLPLTLVLLIARFSLMFLDSLRAVATGGHFFKTGPEDGPPSKEAGKS
jgi:TRAP-type C4-dicarboxylate transport system permease small subunit